MKHLHTVGDVMTHAVIAVGREAPFKEIVESLQHWRISALPVLAGDGRVIGVVSEADLLAREQLGDGASTPADRPGGAEADIAEKARAVTAGQLMSVPAITVRADATIAQAARAMARGNVKRLPVVDAEGRLTGVVSRSDLLKVYLRPDADIAQEVRSELIARLLPAGSSVVEIQVEEGVVTLRGTVPDAALVPLLDRLARTVPGVVHVEAHLSADASGAP